MEVTAAKSAIREAQDRLHALLDEWSAQTERERLEWLANLRHAQQRADHAERQASTFGDALLSSGGQPVH